MRAPVPLAWLPMLSVFEGDQVFSETALRKCGPYGAVVTGNLRRWARTVAFQRTVRDSEITMPSQSSAQCRESLERGHDSIDRGIVNAYFSKGQFGRGLRLWWRVLNGFDENLDDSH